MLKIACCLLGHKPEWKAEHHTAFYDPDPEHVLRCSRCKCYLHPVTFEKYTPAHIGKLW